MSIEALFKFYQYVSYFTLQHQHLNQQIQLQQLPLGFAVFHWFAVLLQFGFWHFLGISRSITMTRAGVNEILAEDDDAVQPIELPGLGVEDEEYACCWSFWHLLSWVLSLVLYTIEFFVTVWVAYTYATNNNMFIPFGISLAYLAIPQIILVTISLTWYYNLDRFHRKRKESDPHNLEFIEYRKKFTIGAIVCHVMLLGLIYRWVRVIIFHICALWWKCSYQCFGALFLICTKLK